MKRLLLLLAACGSKTEPQPSPAPKVADAAVKENLVAQLVGCSAAVARPVDPREPEADVLSPPVRATASVSFGTPSVNGNLDVQIIKRYLHRNSQKLAYCYEKELVQRPAIGKGTIETSFAIQPNGKVVSASADGVDAEVAKCFVKVIEEIEFPKPPDQVQVTFPFKLDAPAMPRRIARPVHEWTPYAIIDDVDEPIARSLADLMTPIVRDKLPAIDQCFDGARGKVRSLLVVNSSGVVFQVRSGGIGDSAIESCITTALNGITTTAPAAGVEVACDFTRGGDAPFRVSPDAGYTVVELTSKEIRNRSSVRDIPPRGQPGVTAIGASSAVLVVADPDAPSTGIEAALWWAPAGATLVSVKAAGGAPVLVGMGDSRAHRVHETEERVVQLRAEAGKLKACIGRVQVSDPAPLLDPHALDRMMAAVKAECAAKPCEDTIVIGTSSDYVAKDLVAVTSAAKRADFRSVSIGGPACD